MRATQRHLAEVSPASAEEAGFYAHLVEAHGWTSDQAIGWIVCDHAGSGCGTGALRSFHRTIAHLDHDRDDLGWHP